jgi:putative ABC transport system ATP-binding protein
MIKLENISKTYQTDKMQTLALAGIDLQVQAGEFVAIMGPSGCGKSTLLNLIGLLDQPDQGSILIDGAPVKSYRDKDVAKLRNQVFGFIFQSFHLIGDLRVLDNVELPLLYRAGSAKTRRELAHAALAKVGLSARTAHYPNELSGGQQQRVAIARAMVGSPKILLADEPTGNLDSQMGNEVMQHLLALNQAGTTIVMVTHDENAAKKCHRCVRIFDGQIVQ